MKLSQLGYMCQVLERFKIRASMLTIQGKGSNTLSMTIPKTHYNKLWGVAQIGRFDLRITADQFLKDHELRVQLTLPPNITRTDTEKLT